jgi:hypothetical protein
LKQKIDWALVLFAIAILICFIELTVIAYGVAKGLSLFMIGFEIAIIGFAVGIADGILLMLCFFEKGIKELFLPRTLMKSPLFFGMVQLNFNFLSCLADAV